MIWYDIQLFMSLPPKWQRLCFSACLAILLPFRGAGDTDEASIIRFTCAFLACRMLHVAVVVAVVTMCCTYADKTFGPTNNNNNNGSKNFSLNACIAARIFWLRLQLHLFGKFLFFLSVETKQAHTQTHTHNRHSYVLPHNTRDHTICAVSNCFLYQQSFRACSDRVRLTHRM